MSQPISQVLNADDFSPQVLRLLQLAAIEAQRNLAERGEKICPEHFLVAILQDADPRSQAFELLNSTGLTIADIRAGVKPKVAPPAAEPL